MAPAEDDVSVAGGGDDDDDGGEGERGHWTGKLDFLLSCLGYAVGRHAAIKCPFRGLSAVGRY